MEHLGKIKGTVDAFLQSVRSTKINSTDLEVSLSSARASVRSIPTWCTRENIRESGSAVAGSFATGVETLRAKSMEHITQKTNNLPTLGRIFSAPLTFTRQLSKQFYKEKTATEESKSTETTVEDAIKEFQLHKCCDKVTDVLEFLKKSPLDPKEGQEAFTKHINELKALFDKVDETQTELVFKHIEKKRPEYDENKINLIITILKLRPKEIEESVSKLVNDHPLEAANFFSKLDQTAQDKVTNMMITKDPPRGELFDVLYLYPDMIDIDPNSEDFNHLIENIQMRSPEAQDLILSYIEEKMPSRIEQFLCNKDPVEAFGILSKFDPGIQDKIIDSMVTNRVFPGEFFDFLSAFPDIESIGPTHSDFNHFLGELQKKSPKYQDLILTYIESKDPPGADTIRNALLDTQIEAFLQSEASRTSTSSWISPDSLKAIDTFVARTKSTGVDANTLIYTKALLNTKILSSEQKTLLQEYQKKTLQEFITKAEYLSLEDLTVQQDKELDLLQDTLPQELLKSFEETCPLLKTARLLDQMLTSPSDYSTVEGQDMFIEFLETVDDITPLLERYENLAPIFEDFIDNFNAASPQRTFTAFTVLPEKTQNIIIENTSIDNQPFLNMLKNNPSFFTTPLTHDHFALFNVLDPHTQNKIIELYTGDERGIEFEQEQINAFFSNMISGGILLSTYTDQEKAPFDKFIDKIVKSTEFDHDLTSKAAYLLNNAHLIDIEESYTLLHEYQDTSIKDFLHNSPGSPSIDSIEGKSLLLNNPTLLTIEQEQEFEKSQIDSLKTLLTEMGSTKHGEYPVEKLQELRYLTNSLTEGTLHEISDDFPQLHELTTSENMLMDIHGLSSDHYADLSLEEKTLFEDFVSSASSLEHYVHDEKIQSLIDTFIQEEFTGDNLLHIHDYFYKLESPVQNYITKNLQEAGLHESVQLLEDVQINTFLSKMITSRTPLSACTDQEKALFDTFIDKTTKSTNFDHTLTSQAVALLNNPHLIDDEESYMLLQSYQDSSIKDFLHNSPGSPSIDSIEGKSLLLKDLAILTIEQEQEFEKSQVDSLKTLLTEMGSTKHGEYPIEKLQEFRYLINSLTEKTLHEISVSFPQLHELVTSENILMDINELPSDHYTDLSLEEKTLFKDFLSSVSSLEHYVRDGKIESLLHTFIQEEFQGDNLLHTGYYFHSLENPVRNYIVKNLQETGLHESIQFLRSLVVEEKPEPLPKEAEERTRALANREKILNKTDTDLKSMQNILQNIQNDSLEALVKDLATPYAYDSLVNEEREQLDILLRSTTNQEILKKEPLDHIIAVHNAVKELSSGNTDSLEWFLENIQDFSSYTNLSSAVEASVLKELNTFMEERSPEKEEPFLKDFFSYSIGKQTALLSVLLNMQLEGEQQGVIKETINHIQENYTEQETSSEDFDKLARLFQKDEPHIRQPLIDTPFQSREVKKRDALEDILVNKALKDMEEMKLSIKAAEAAKKDAEEEKKSDE